MSMRCYEQEVYEDLVLFLFFPGGIVANSSWGYRSMIPFMTSKAVRVSPGGRLTPFPGKVSSFDPLPMNNSVGKSVIETEQPALRSGEDQVKEKERTPWSNDGKILGIASIFL